MSTVIRPEISKKNANYISKYRYLELKNFCLQYPEWKETYAELEQQGLSAMPCGEYIPNKSNYSDPTERIGIAMAEYRRNMDMIENAAKQADPYLCDYILKGVTEKRGYTYLETVCNIPCGKDMYYDRYRRFFNILSEKREINISSKTYSDTFRVLDSDRVTKKKMLELINEMEIMFGGMDVCCAEEDGKERIIPYKHYLQLKELIINL